MDAYDLEKRFDLTSFEVLEIALQYISNQDSDGAFVDFVEQQALVAQGYQPVDEWRGSVSQALRGQGRDDLADAFGALSDTEAQDYQLDHSDPDVIAQIVIGEDEDEA